MINDVKIDIPDYQRQYIWDYEQANAFLITIMDGMPTLSLILSEEVVDRRLVRWLEDGQQRFMTVKKFYKNEFTENVKDEKKNVRWNNRKFSDFTPEEKTRFENYLFTITTMEDVPRQRRLELFQAIQRGTPLTNGNRFHAYPNSPVINMAKGIMVYPRFDRIFGDRMVKDPKQTNLTHAVAIASGAAFNDGDAITTSYDILGMKGLLTASIDSLATQMRIDKLASVYERADEICPTTLAKKKPQWAVGKYTGYILYSMWLPDRNWEADKEMFAQFIARVRRDKLAMNILTYKKPATRNWNSGRWKQGLDNLDNQEKVEKDIGMSPSDDDDEDENNE